MNKITRGFIAALTATTLTLTACASSHQEAIAGDPSLTTSRDCGGKHTLHIGGSSAQKAAMEQFGYTYSAACPGYRIDYTPSGSQTAIDNFITRTLDIASTDFSLDTLKPQQDKATERCGSPVWNLPIVFDPIAITYNLPGHYPPINLDGLTIAKVFSGTIDTWDHPLIKALNPGLSLPSLPIHVIYRSDHSSTTAALQRYLEWVTNGRWGGGITEVFTGYPGEAAASNQAVATALHNTEGSISYNEWSFAESKGIPMARLITVVNANPVTITPQSVAQTINGVTFITQGNDLAIDPLSLYRGGDRTAYPIVLPTYALVCSKYSDPATTTALKAFFHSALERAQDDLDQYGVIPLPDTIKTKILTAIDAIQ